MNSMKKKLSILLALVMCMCAVTVAPLAFGDDLVQINATTFPDATFRRVIGDDFDFNGDGYLDAAERSITTMQLSERIDFDTEEILDLKGVELFTNLRVLRCGGIWLERLDVSALSELRELTCQGNMLESLDLSHNLRLETLNCLDNSLTSLILPSTSTLKKIDCRANFLESLDVTRLYGLTELICTQNELRGLNLSYNTALTTLDCSENHIPALDLSRTAIAQITNDQIGNQTIDSIATADYNRIIVPFNYPELNSANYRGCSLDMSNTGSCFQTNRFVVYDLEDIPDGYITYECYPQLENAENMTVKINVIRSCHQVEFYTDSTLSEKLESLFVNDGAGVTPPIITDTPQCKLFNSWSSDLTSINEDLTVYAQWSDNHRYAPVAMADDLDLITVGCVNGDSSYQVSFISIVNTKQGHDGFDDNIDVVDDGYINAKDYDVLLAALR